MPTILQASTHNALIAASLLGLTLLVAGCSSSASSGPTAAPTPHHRTAPTSSMHSPVAIVNGAPIAGQDFATAVAQEQANLALQAKQTGGRMPSVRQIRAAVLNNLIDMKVVGLYAATHGIVVRPEEVAVEFARAQANSGGATAFATRLKAYGLTASAARTRLRDGLLLQRVQQRVVGGAPVIEEVQARHILVKSYVLAQQIDAQLRRHPALFAAMAKKFSIDPASASRGGELGFFPRGVMVAPFERAAFSQPVGYIGTPVQSPYGYHIIQVEARKKVPPSQLDQSTQQMYLRQEQATFARWLAAQRTHDHVRILMPL